MRDLVARLIDARDYARLSAGYVRGIDVVSFACDQMRKDAVCFCLLIVGEACNEAAKELSELPEEIPWRQIKGMRNIIVREYWQIDERIIYNSARNEAEPLADILDRLIKDFT